RRAADHGGARRARARARTGTAADRAPWRRAAHRPLPGRPRLRRGGRRGRTGSGFWTEVLSGDRMTLPHPTICLHKAVFQLTSELTKPVSTSDQRDNERLLRAAL